MLKLNPYNISYNKYLLYIVAKGSSLAMSALAGLASTEDFKNVALKRGAPIEPVTEKNSLLQVKGLFSINI